MVKVGKMNFKFTIQCDKCNKKQSGDENSIYISAYSCNNCNSFLSKLLTYSCNFCHSEITIYNYEDRYHRCNDY